MLTSFKQFLRRIKLLKPCPVKHYRKEDLDFIFNLYNTDDFTLPFEPGYPLTNFLKNVTQLHTNLNIHRNPDDEQNSKQANTVFYNLVAILKLEIPLVYDAADWRCLAMDTLRFNCSEAINDLLTEYNYNDHIHNHRLYTHTALFAESKPASDQREWLLDDINEIKRFLSTQKLSPTMADEYFGMIYRHAVC